jgi:ribosomal protein L27
MLVAKISPAAKKIIQKTPFEQEVLTGEYMIVQCNKYVIGSIVGSFNDENYFELKFGSIKYEQNPDGTNGKPMLDTVVSQRLKLTTPEVENWGTDDSVVFDIIAQKLGITIVEITAMDMQFTA